MGLASSPGSLGVNKICVGGELRGRWTRAWSPLFLLSQLPSDFTWTRILFVIFRVDDVVRIAESTSRLRNCILSSRGITASSLLFVQTESVFIHSVIPSISPTWKPWLRAWIRRWLTRCRRCHGRGTNLADPKRRAEASHTSSASWKRRLHVAAHKSIMLSSSAFCI